MAYPPVELLTKRTQARLQSNICSQWIRRLPTCMLQYAKNALQELLKNIFICFYNMKNYNNNKILVGKRGNNKEIDG